MVAITAINYTTPAAQVWQGQARLDQARRDADQAETRARQLRNQASQAEQDAQKDQARVSTLSAQQSQADSTYSAQLQQHIVGSAGSAALQGQNSGRLVNLSV